MTSAAIWAAFPALSPLMWAVLLAVALVSAFIRGLSGFGMALMLVPVMALSVAPEDAVIAANILGFSMGVASFRNARKVAEGTVKTIGLLAILMTPVGLLLLDVTPDGVARLLIALVATTAFVAFLLPEPRLSDRHVGALAAGSGMMSGLFAGFAGMPGPPVIAFYLGRRVEKAMARSSMFVIFLVTSATACVSALVLGIGSLTAVWLGVVLVPVALLGNWLGSLAFGKVSDLAWRLLAGAIVAAAAIAALKDAL